MPLAVQHSPFRTSVFKLCEQEKAQGDRSCSALQQGMSCAVPVDIYPLKLKWNDWYTSICVFSMTLFSVSIDVGTATLWALPNKSGCGGCCSHNSQRFVPWNRHFSLHSIQLSCIAQTDILLYILIDWSLPSCRKIMHLSAFCTWCQPGMVRLCSNL